MKKILLLSIASLLSLNLSAQFATYKSEKERFDALKQCSMLVIGVDNPASAKWLKFQENVSKYWSIVPIKLMKFGEAKRYQNKAKIATLQFSISTGGEHDKVGFTMAKAPGGIGSGTPAKAGSFPVLNIFIYGKDKKGGMSYQAVFSQIADNSAKPTLAIYTLVNFLRMAQSELSRPGKDIDFFDNDRIIKKESLAKLLNTELVIPDDELIHFPPKKPEADKKKEYEALVKPYTYNHRIISMDEADSLVLNDAPVAMFCYARYNGERYVFVIDNSTGELLYKDHYSSAYPIKDKDFADLDKSVGKSKK